VRCIFSHVRSISYDFVCSNRMLCNLRGVHFEFSHTVDPKPSLVSVRFRAAKRDLGIPTINALRPMHLGRRR
jgi:hypothetical protein